MVHIILATSMRIWCSFTIYYLLLALILVLAVYGLSTGGDDERNNQYHLLKTTWRTEEYRIFKIFKIEFLSPPLLLLPRVGRVVLVFQSVAFSCAPGGGCVCCGYTGRRAGAAAAFCLAGCLFFLVFAGGWAAAALFFVFLVLLVLRLLACSSSALELELHKGDEYKYKKKQYKKNNSL